MSLVTIPGGGFPFPVPPFALSAGVGFSGLVLDAAGEKVGMVLRVPRTGTLARVGFRTGVVTTAQDLRVSFQDLDGSADPDGVQDQFRTVGSIVAQTWFETGLLTSDGTDSGSQRQVQQGEILAIVIEFESTVGDLVISRGASDEGNEERFPHSTHFTAAWVRQEQPLQISLEYADGQPAPIPRTMPFSTSSALSFNTGSTPDERGNRFLLPFPCRVRGLWVGADLDTGASDVVLYQGTTEIDSTSIPAGLQSGAIAGVHWVDLPGSHRLDAGVEYFASLRPSTGTNVGIIVVSFDARKNMDQYWGGRIVHEATRTDAGAWSTNTLVRSYLGLVIDQIENGGDPDLSWMPVSEGGGPGKGVVISG